MISPDSEYEGLSDHLGKKSHKTDQIIYLYVIFFAPFALSSRRNSNCYWKFKFQAIEKLMGRSVTEFLMLMKTLGLPREQ